MATREPERCEKHDRLISYDLERAQICCIECFDEKGFKKGYDHVWEGEYDGPPKDTLQGLADKQEQEASAYKEAHERWFKSQVKIHAALTYNKGLSPREEAALRQQAALIGGPPLNEIDNDYDYDLGN